MFRGHNVIVNVPEFERSVGVCSARNPSYKRVSSEVLEETLFLWFRSILQQKNLFNKLIIS